MRDNRLRSPFPWALTAILVVAVLLRIGGPLSDARVQHPDEFHFVYWPLYFTTGDLDPQHTLTAFYPALHYYLLGLLYFVYFLLQLPANGWSLEQFAMYHFFWDTDSLLHIARWTGVFFAVGTVAWVAFLARRVAGSLAGYIAALLLAFAPLHIRQSGLAAVDIPMAFWYVAAVWAALRLLEKSSWKAYAVAGVFVGLAAASKYPGALSGAAVVAAHWTAKRSWKDRRLWWAGAISVAAFFVATPYTLLDWQTFVGHFSREAAHLQEGHGQSLGVGWWYHIKVSLRYGLGWLGLGLGLAGVWVAWRSPAGRVLVVALVAYYLVMGSGELVFVRYALPLLVLLAVLAALALTAIVEAQRGARVRWAYALAFCALAEPLYAALSITRLQTASDTRLQAVEWIEQHLPSGAICCNFGGWAGDVPVDTVEELWWKINHYERLWGRDAMDRMRPFLLESGPSHSFFSYAIHPGNRHYEQGSMAAARELDCSYVIVHEHALAYSTLDSTFLHVLAERGERVARFSQPGHAVYDPIDGHYMPIGKFAALQRTGPAIEVWRLRAAEKRWNSLREVLARAYLRGAATQLGTARLEDALALVQRSLVLNERDVDAYWVAAQIFARAGRTADALNFYERALALGPERADLWRDAASAYQSLGEKERAQHYMDKARALE